MEKSIQQTNIKTLIHEVSHVIDKNEKLIASTGARFNMFEICGVSHYETTHSAIIAQLLNPKGTHGCKALFLNAFLKTAFQNENFYNFTENCRVTIEFPTNNGFIDILITEQQHAICIENKVYASDQWEQLKRYNEYLQKKYPNNYTIMYLTLNGNKASEQSGEGVEYIQLSYKKHIVQWLEECIKISQNKPIVSETLRQYQNHIKKLTGTSLEDTYMQEIIQMICKNNENFQTAKEIAQIVQSPKMMSYLLQEKLYKHSESLKKIIHEKIGTETVLASDNPDISSLHFKIQNTNYEIAIGFNEGDITLPYIGAFDYDNHDNNNFCIVFTDIEIDKLMEAENPIPYLTDCIEAIAPHVKIRLSEK